MLKVSKVFVFCALFSTASLWAAALDSAKVATPAVVSAALPKDSNSTEHPLSLVEPPVLELKRQTPDFRIFNDRALIGREYGFGMAGSLVAGALGFYIGSGIETAISGSKEAHQGTLEFSGIRYDNYYGAFWGGSTGLLFGSAFTTYFIGQSDEDDGYLYPTILGAALATGGALAIASWMGVNDDIGWTPFIPLLAIPSLGGVAGFNISRWFSDHKREKAVNPTADVHILAPRFGWTHSHDAGDGFIVQALNLSF